MDDEAPARRDVMAYGLAERGTATAGRNHLHARSVRHAAVYDPADEDALQRPPVAQPTIKQLHMAQLGNWIVGIAQLHFDFEAVGDVARDKRECQSIGLIAGDAHEGRR